MAGQGGKASLELSLSCDRSSVSVDHSTITEYNAISDEVHSYKCKGSVNAFCYIYAELVLKKHMKLFNEERQKMNKDFLKIEVLNLTWEAQIICNNCRSMLLRWTNKKGNIKFDKPKIWRRSDNERDY